MTMFSSSRTSVGAILVTIAVATVACGQTWTGSIDNDWTKSGNWDSGVPGSGAIASFQNAGNGNTNISLGGSAQPIGNLVFQTASAAAYTIGQLPGDSLSFDDLGGILVDSTVTNPQTINASVQIPGPNGMLVVNNVSNGGALVGTGLVGLTFGDVNIGGGILSITNGQDGTATTATALNGDISGPGALDLFAPSGGGSAGTTNNNFLINGNNTYSGGTLIQANTGSQGSIQIGTDSPFGTGKVHNVFQGNSVEFRAVGGTHTIPNDFDLDGGMNFAGENSIVLAGDIAIASGTTRTIFNKMTATGTTLTLGATPGSSVIYLGNPSSNGGDDVGRVVILQANSGSRMIVNATFQDVGTGSAVRFGSSNGGHIVINAPQTYTSETQIGGGEATVEF
ncbi:MAG TPA: hypothetical protein VHE81_22580, partial [Lacipirellulaceae bacterium]|nr:hypothetical protein [Lacipirellulaceae bacterium]